MLLKLLDFVHLFFLFHPLLLPFLSKVILQKLIPWLMLLIVVTPIHWVFFNNQCILTNISKKAGAYQNSETTSEFSENNLQWLYKPIMNLIGWKWNSEGLNKMAHLHWFINFIIVWYLQFFILQKN